MMSDMTKIGWANHLSDIRFLYDAEEVDSSNGGVVMTSDDYDRLLDLAHDGLKFREEDHWLEVKRAELDERQAAIEGDEDLLVRLRKFGELMSKLNAGEIISFRLSDIAGEPDE